MMSMRFVVLFYAGMGALGWGIAQGWFGLDPWSMQGASGPAQAWHVALGAGFGLGIVALSALLERHAAWARRLSQAFRDTLGPLGLPQIAVIAVMSALGEELLFRGLIQQGLAARAFDGLTTVSTAHTLALIVSSVLFGLLHIGTPFRTYLPWTIMAIVMGASLGGMFWWTGSLWAPIVAHFTINFFNLIEIMRSDPDPSLDKPS